MFLIRDKIADIVKRFSGSDGSYRKIFINGEAFSKSTESTDSTEKKEETNSFSKESRESRKTTIGYRASAEIHSAIFQPDTGLFMPWQTENHRLYPVTLKTTYEEIQILWNEESRCRPEFGVEGNNIYIPNIFAKITGVHNDFNSYARDVRAYLAAQNTVIFERIPFGCTQYTKPDDKILTGFVYENKILNRDKIKNSSFYKYAYLRSSLQNLIFNGIQRLLNSEEVIFLTPVKEKFINLILSCCLSLSPNILRQLETFDYPKSIPKVIVYANNKELFCWQDCIILALLNSIGLDIMILTPANYNNIEGKINSNLYDTHRLENVNFEISLNQLKTMRIKNTKNRESFFKRKNK